MSAPGKLRARSLDERIDKRLGTGSRPARPVLVRGWYGPKSKPVNT